MRKLRRSVAHTLMKQQGYAKVNKKFKGQSFFSGNWRKFTHGLETYR